jgi:LacI family transcriptional regulator
MKFGTEVNMAEIARQAGVSKAAVSVAFSGRKGKIGVSEETRKRVLKIAAKLGYSPNPMGRSLSMKKSHLIALLGRESYFVFALDTIKGIESVLRDRDYSLLTYYDGSWADDQARHLRLALDRRVDGLIIAGAPEAPDGANHKRVADLRKKGVPVVQLYRRIYPDVPVVMTDEDRAGYLATHHLLELGHTRIAHVTHSAYLDRELPGTHADALQRAQGYERAMREAGLKPQVIDYDAQTMVGLDYTRLVKPAVDQLRHGGFTAATCFCDYVAIGVMNQLAAAGVRVPKDFSVVGYDNANMSEMCNPPLTTLGQPLQEIGATAARMIFELMDKKEVSDTIYEPIPVVRESTHFITVEPLRKSQVKNRITR